MSKLVIHVGMPKTGSSSIQETLFDVGVCGEFTYADLGCANHGGVLRNVFSSVSSAHEADSQNTHDKKGGATLALSKLDEVRKLSGHQILSGEPVWHFSEAALLRMKHFFEDAFDEIQIVAYVRSPVSFMASAFQQLVKNHECASLDFNALYPRYREKFEKFDRVFGVDHVILRHFEPSLFPRGDVVLDFFHLLSGDVDVDLIKRVNESISLEATSVLFAYRKFVTQDGSSPRARKENRGLLSVLSNLEGRRLRFSREAVAPIIDANRKDIDWIEKRLGQAILDEGDVGYGVISSERELLDIALLQYSAVQNMVNRQSSLATPSLSRLVSLVDSLKTGLSAKDGEAVCEDGALLLHKRFFATLNDTAAPVQYVLRELAIAFERQGMFDEALAVLAQALKLSPEDASLTRAFKRVKRFAQVDGASH
ncbi:MAG: tetratricopeptide repeat protein [Pseudomonadota bacterium]